MRHIRRHLTYANVISTLALFLVLGGGTAVALNGSNTVFSDDITDNEVRTADVRNDGQLSRHLLCVCVLCLSPLTEGSHAQCESSADHCQRTVQHYTFVRSRCPAMHEGKQLPAPGKPSIAIVPSACRSRAAVRCPRDRMGRR